MLNYYQPSDRWERLPVAKPNRCIPRTEVAAAEASMARSSVDAILELIEGSNADVRFVPDWADEGVTNAA